MVLNVSLLLKGILCFIIAHIGAFYQLNGQFIWKSFRDNEWLVAAFGFLISFFYIWGTKYTVEAMDGLLWPARFIGFGIGMFQYALFVSYYFQEGINIKTWVSLFLCLILISIQVFWKTT
jgi:hypothetical protein|tara:strand:- start:3004 stop:3363 length:360 start_codon:yes stop_codon:yes gene_type:complete